MRVVALITAGLISVSCAGTETSGTMTDHEVITAFADALEAEDVEALTNLVSGDFQARDYQDSANAIYLPELVEIFDDCEFVGILEGQSMLRGGWYCNGNTETKVAAFRIEGGLVDRVYFGYIPEVVTVSVPEDAQ